MPTKHALIIGAPDEKIPGVVNDTENIADYLKSPIGGYWHSSEITTLNSPRASNLIENLQLLESKDYSFVFFAGHGYYSVQRKRTIIHINSAEIFDSLNLRQGAPKHSLILDCCRKPEEEKLIKKSITMESATYDSVSHQKIDPLECRKYFNNAIAQCENGLVVMNACSIGQTAGESNEGGYYTSSLISSATDWAMRKLRAINLANEYATYSTQECHEAALPLVSELSGRRQTPVFESPRTVKKFPFSVVA